MPGKTYSREFILSWTDLMMKVASRGHQVMISQQYSSCVHFSRAKCLGGDVLKGPDQKPFQGSVEYDVMMWIDSDIIFKPDDFFTILESPHDVTAGMYMMEDLAHFATVTRYDNDYFLKNGSYKFMRPEDIEGAPRYIPVEYTGMGWMAIRKGVVEDLKYPWFFTPLETVSESPLVVEMNSEDVSFCKALNAAGHQVYVDSTVRVGHQKMLIV